MLVLGTDQLRVTLIDPEADRARLGPRYCAGGYIWQVRDQDGRELLTGPEGPAPEPSPFNGHGLPEAFRERTRDGRLLTWSDGTGVAIGAGLVQFDPAREVRLVEPCPWSITRTEERLTFRTEHGAGDRAYALDRVIELKGRDLLSLTSLTNTGRTPLATQWFAHPFFPIHPATPHLATLPFASRLPENPGLRLTAGQLSLRRRFAGRDDGQFALLELPAEPCLTVFAAHPACGEIRLTTTFAPSECPVWANGYTWSIEPYQAIDLQPGQTRRWALHYSFGTADRASAANSGIGPGPSARDPLD